MLLADSCLHLQARFSSKKASHDSFLIMLEMQTRDLACRRVWTPDVDPQSRC